VCVSRDYYTLAPLLHHVPQEGTWYNPSMLLVPYHYELLYLTYIQLLKEQAESVDLALCR
jgi:hypothetical protein